VIERDPLLPGRESVWDYPRPPRLEPTTRLLRVVFAGAVVAETRRGLRVLETSHPPTYYFPPEDVDATLLLPGRGTSYCEWKGRAEYRTIRVGDREALDAAWLYRSPTRPFAALRDHLAFFPARVDGCFVDGEQARPQGGGFYGGWITGDLAGPFKGEPGTAGW
jgi:uncharacterized protein (DUF427 family)